MDLDVAAERDINGLFLFLIQLGPDRLIWEQLKV